jgi:hypothetical protein
MVAVFSFPGNGQNKPTRLSSVSQLLTGTVLVAHHQIQTPHPSSVMLTEPAVGKTLRVALLYGMGKVIRRLQEELARFKIIRDSAKY